ncbi:MAG: hypothetical protein FJY97_15820 [candidate division Zixibacteria bacterium]|nr:hypothetical protein [candidate division Zixibacteria bacterium]
MAKAAKTAIKSGGKDRSFAAKMTKGNSAAEVAPTSLIIRPQMGDNGFYKFRRVLTKMTAENKKALGMA